eukprot:CAMPEP_0182436112 /NCGR_PEP_ID=MMETSP1167-20130531/79585_1 /TAXON_ID=2988 /ORGANISM="Mallomonas Sp, Strain CCMP3275" /LENGTH=66 /DNA_ID=CAMNT_0024627897 /DNA_START=182 /DNA_END=379 /DNA_ORIENTATION=-
MENEDVANDPEQPSTTTLKSASTEDAGSYSVSEPIETNSEPEWLLKLRNQIQSEPSFQIYKNNFPF